MKNIQTLSSANRMVVNHFQALRRLCYRVECHQDNNYKKQDASLCVIQSVLVVEIFMNVYFRILITEAPDKSLKQKIITDLDKKVSLDQKIKDWPNIVFGKKINFSSGVGQKFLTLKETRNKLIHFSSTHESLELPGIKINGLADTTVYDSLDDNTAKDALEIAESFICEIFTLNGVAEDELCHSLHAWTGKAPILKKG